MADIHLLIPKQARPLWHPALEMLDLESEPMQEIPLLGMVTAGLPVDLCEQQETVSVPGNMVRQQYLRPARQRPLHDR
jgi:repressor LexA